MNSDMPRPCWLTLAWWHRHDQRLKRALAARFGTPAPWTDEQRCRFIEKASLVLGIPFILTPGVTNFLFPSLQQKDATLFFFAAAFFLSAGLLACLKRADLARETRGSGAVSCHPATRREIVENRCTEVDEETQTGS